MAKATKTTTTTPKTTASKSTKASAAPVIEAAPAPVPTPVVQAAAPAEEPSAEATASVFSQFSDFMAKLQSVSAQMSALRTEFRNIERQVSRDLKAASKVSQKRKRKSGNRAPSGFVKPTRISDELAKFLEKPAGSEMARTEVTRDINKYIRTHKLQDEANGRKINPDSKLAALLKLKKTDELTYFNLQKFMGPHFEKSVPAVVA